MANKLANEVNFIIEKEEGMFDFRTPDTPPVLLVVDRRSDLITPLLLHWTYLSMLHDHFCIRNGKLESDDQQTLMLLDDPFLKANKYSMFGTLGENISKLVKEFEQKNRKNAHLDSIPEMKQFVNEYSEFEKLREIANKHLRLFDQISKKVEVENLYPLSETQQEFAASWANFQTLYGTFKEKMNSIEGEKRLILSLIFALKNHKNPLLKLNEFGEWLSEEDLKMVEFIVNKLTLHSHQPDMQHVKGLDSFKYTNVVYTQHIPMLVSIVETLMRGKLNTSTFPFVNASQGSIYGQEKPQDIIVFMLGGSTFEEEHALRKLVEAVPAVNIVFGGTTIQSTSSMLKEMRHLKEKFAK
jgi:vacuolar protein sorting-associated protein 45